MTKILFDRAGGLMGRKVSLTLDLDSLPPPQAETLRGLLETSNFFSLPESIAEPGAPDEFIYTITVNTGMVEHTIQTRDTAMDESVRPLVEELGRLARKG